MIAPSTVVFRLAVALIGGVIIGFERDLRAKHAGVKTNALVALGAAGFAAVTDHFGIIGGNPSHIAASVVTGIGFIGAGVIVHHGRTIQGVTTAATLWANASMSLAVGLGNLSVGATLLGGVVIVQFLLRRLEPLISRARARQPAPPLELFVEADADALSPLTAALAELPVLRSSASYSGERIHWHVVLDSSPTTTPLELRLLRIAGVQRVSITSAPLRD